MSNERTETSVRADFQRIFDNKCDITSLAEKSISNWYYISRNTTNLRWRLHYFAVGHCFKSLPVSSDIIFRRYYDEQEKKHCYGDYQSLLVEQFALNEDTKDRDKDLEDRGKNLEAYISHLRNLNSHYVHTFDYSQIDKSSPVGLFLKDALRMATTMTFIDSQKLWDKWKQEAREALGSKGEAGLYTSEDYDTALRDKYAQHLKSEEFRRAYSTFLADMFYPKPKQAVEQEPSDKANEVADPNQQLRQAFIEQSIDKCIDSLLFVEVSEDIDWELPEKHKIMTIGKGTYLSFTGSLFLLSMFLYKDEAVQLISAISGYKKTDGEEMRYKRDIMTFFAKKRSSQDYNNEERQLINARDIIQYLGKYPIEWNKSLDLDSSQEIGIAEQLKRNIEFLEIERLFPDMVKDTTFRDYAWEHIFNKGNNEALNERYEVLLTKHRAVKHLYDKVKQGKFDPQEYKNDPFKLFTLRYVTKTYFAKDKKLRVYFEQWKLQWIGISKEVREQFNNWEKTLATNSDVEIVKSRVQDKTFYTSYGRNQDRFMEMAIRYLAETNYFGEDAEFKMYQFYTTDEQTAYLEQEQEALENSAIKNLSKQEYDALKFHRGKLTHYCTYREHQERYPDWDTPFVVENNAFQVILQPKRTQPEVDTYTHTTDTEQQSKALQEAIADKPDPAQPNYRHRASGTIISIQRPLLVYILQDALFRTTQEHRGGETHNQSQANTQGQNPNSGSSHTGGTNDQEQAPKAKGSSENLLDLYLRSAYQEDYARVRDAFKQKDKEQLPLMRQLLPHRAIKKQFADPPLTRSSGAYHKILLDAEEQEKRYQQQCTDKKNVSPVAYNNFIRKNKGKQFKLQFVRKAWHIMYFKEIYKRQVSAQAGHHKHFHITRDEYNDFCRFLFAMDAVPQYKECLRALLTEKGFMQCSEFQQLFDKGISLDAYYDTTKEKFKAWIDQQGEEPITPDKYNLEKYINLGGDKIVYINLSHFRNFLKVQGQLVVNAKAMSERAMRASQGRADEPSSTSEVTPTSEGCTHDTGSVDMLTLPALCNRVYLIDDYYLGSKCPNKDQQKARTMYNALKSYRLEDCLLYEIAIRYFTENGVDPQKIKYNIREILTSECPFTIEQTEENSQYTMLVPFKQIERFVGIAKHLYYNSEGKPKKNNYLSKVPQYLKQAKERDSIKQIAERFDKKRKITLNDFEKVQTDILLESRKFLAIYMELERYFIEIDKIRIKPNDKTSNKKPNRITYWEIEKLQQLVDSNDRNTACHFGVPNELYETKIEKLTIDLLKRGLLNDVLANTNLAKIWKPKQAE